MITHDDDDWPRATFQTEACPRMFPDVPFVGCFCDDCVTIRWRREMTPADRRFLRSMRIAQLATKGKQP